MKRDSFLLLLVGVLVGFIAGYILHEVMAARQPPRQVAGAPPVGQTQAPPPPGSAAASSPTAAMEQVQRLRSYVEANPEDEEALLTLANMNYDIQNWSRAVELYERYLRLDPDNPMVMVDLGASLRSSGQPDRALELFARARELAPENWQARYNEILVLAFDKGDGPASRSALAELQALQPENRDVARLAAEVARRFPG